MAGKHRNEPRHRKDPRHRGRHRKPPSPARIALPTGTGVAVAIAAVVMFAHDDAHGQVAPHPPPTPVVAPAVQPSVLGFHTTRPEPVKVRATHHSPVALRIHATADCYVQVTTRRGSLLVRRILHRHDSLGFRHHGLDVVLGNAGGVRIAVDGRRAHVAGASGQVRRFHIDR